MTPDQVATALVQRHVDLESYSSSPGFLGHFERLGEFDEGLCPDALEVLWRTFHSLPPQEVWLVSSLRLLGGLGELKESYELSEDHAERLSRLLDSDLVLAAGDGTEALTATRGFDRAQLGALCFAAMAVDGVRGHCFLLAEAAELIAYPHEDLGFGYIGLGGEADAGGLLPRDLGAPFRFVSAPPERAISPEPDRP